MRIALVGKGGSGKTTLASLLVRRIQQTGQPLLAIDADINQHLGSALGYNPEVLASIPELGNSLPRLKTLLRGTNPRISSPASMVKTTLPGPGSHLIRLHPYDPVLSSLSLLDGHTYLMRVGGFSDADLGTRCYHAKTGGAELVLNHLMDGPAEWVVVDMTAGADAFASGMFTRFDLTLLAVEPTLKSVEVYRQYRGYAQGFDLAIRAIGNKVETPGDLAFLKSCGADLIGHLTASSWVKRQQQGRMLPFTELESDNGATLDRILQVVRGLSRDWSRYWHWGMHFHRQNALSWANAAAGEDVTGQIDEEFLTRFRPDGIDQRVEGAEVSDNTATTTCPPM